MKLLRRHLPVALLLGLTLIPLSACGDDDGDGDTTATESPSEEEKGAITIGSADFSDSSIVAAMYAEVLEDAGYDVTRQFNIGARDTYFPALEDGEIDLVPEFVGTLAVFLDENAETSSDADETKAALDEVLPEGLVALEPSEAESTNVFVVTADTAESEGLEAVSDLAGKEADLTLGGPPECPERPFCMLGLNDVYGIDFTDNFRPLDAGGPLTKEALSGGDIDVALLFSTDGAILENGWTVLEDDEELQQADNVIAVGREEALDEEAQELIDEVGSTLTNEDYNELNKRVGVDQEDPEDVAREYVEEKGLIGS
ncbi:MAG: ABC transporter substrate-binding protein [Acidimicrobiia bacterium]|nr:ABC transporter substrate-binding protein [Acidimicrobiia bacterium]